MMDYKQIIKNREMRGKILGIFDFIPDSVMIKLQYRIKTGRRLNLTNPQRYTEKLQWLKINYRNEIMLRCVDKFEVRQVVLQRGYGHVLNDVYGVYDDPEEINFDLLPKSFVLKDTLGSGGNSVILVYDKSKENYETIKEQLRKWVSITENKKNPGREWVYEGRKHRIIVEKMLIKSETEDLPDYKFFCFDGKVRYIYMMENYTQHHEEGVLGFLTPDFILLPAHRKDFKPMLVQPHKPENLNEMIEVAEKLSEGFPHVRVDLYNINGKVVFGELTFFNASGYTLFDPDEFDFELGKYLIIPPWGGST